MKHYIGTKQILAKPMTRQEYNDYRDWKLPSDEDGTDEGYLVEYPGGGKNHDKHEGYISWSSKQQFDEDYQQSGGMSFGHALLALKQGKKVARTGWNGKDMWISISSNLDGKKVHATHFWSNNNAEFAFNEPEHYAHVLPSISMKTACGSILIGWLASQTDLLTEDWCIVD